MGLGVAVAAPNRRVCLENHDVADVDLTLLDHRDDAQICGGASGAAAGIPVQGAAATCGRRIKDNCWCSAAAGEGAGVVRTGSHREEVQTTPQLLPLGGQSESRLIDIYLVDTGIERGDGIAALVATVVVEAIEGAANTDKAVSTFEAIESIIARTTALATEGIAFLATYE